MKLAPGYFEDMRAALTALERAVEAKNPADIAAYILMHRIMLEQIENFEVRAPTGQMMSVNTPLMLHALDRITQ